MNNISSFIRPFLLSFLMPAPFLAGAKLFFPNVVIKLVRSNLPPHQQVFHCPPQLNKLDIKQLLQKMYNIGITDIRTMNYLPKHDRNKSASRRVSTNIASYKKVIVTMDQDFDFPPPPNVKDGAIRLPLITGRGKGSANKLKHKILKEARELGTENATMTSQNE
jgi:ribosomal protein L23